MAIAPRSRLYVRIFTPLAMVLLLVVLWLTGLLATVKPIATAQTRAAVMEGGVAFDRVAYVDEIWGSKVLPTVDEKSMEIATLLPALEKDADAAAKEHGNNVGGADNFLVHLVGSVTAVDTASLTGTVTVSAPVDGKTVPVKLQVGPIILGTALRDAVRFISFEQFTNQIQFGGVSDELNTRVTRDVLSKIDVKSLQGKRVDVKGAFIFDPANPRDILVTPVIVKVE